MLAKDLPIERASKPRVENVNSVRIGRNTFDLGAVVWSPRVGNDAIIYSRECKELRQHAHQGRFTSLSALLKRLQYFRHV